MSFAHWRSSLHAHTTRMWAVALVEGLRLLRDRTSLSLILLVPAVQIALFGYAINLNPDHLTLAIAHSEPLEEVPADWLLQSVRASGYFTVIATDLPSGSAASKVASGEALMGIEFNAAGEPSLVVDASDPATVRPAVLALQTAMLRQLGQALLDDELPELKVQWLYNPDVRSAWAITPGLAGVVVMISMLMLGALTLVREREQGTWEALLATPVSALDALIGKLLPYLVLGVLQAALVIYVSHVLFAMPLRGNLATLLLAALLLSAAHLVLGFALSAWASNQMQAIQAAVFFYLPSMLLSGFMFPFAGMPRWAQVIGELLPLTHFVRVARGVLLRGENFSYVCTEMSGVVIFTLLATLLAILSYRRRLN